MLLHSDELSVDGVTFCAKEVETGEKIYAIGNSKGQGICILDGIVSDSERLIAAINSLCFPRRLFTVIPADLYLTVTAK